ncbi:MAG TPA: protein-glutamate O-methyltransferase CheR [Labilithrix sp.]|nr:protein-glutamate O-methyltransferase CheR [Labilithrix sp.]
MTASAESVKYLRDLVKRRSAIVIEDGKEYLVQARLEPVAREEGVRNIDELITVVRRNEDSPAARKVVEAMTTNETSFFRDVHPWETLKKTILPALVDARATSRRLRIWCAAASTGQEPYTIAMVIREHFPELASWDVQILATDINRAVLERAKTGTYRQLEVNRGLPAPLLVKYFQRKGAEWELKPEIRQMVTFEALNLVERWTLFSTHDLVYMRNVLIYFDVPTKREILSRTRQHLGDDGYLVLGGAETTLNLDDQWDLVRAGNTIVYQPRNVEPNKVFHASR